MKAVIVEIRGNRAAALLEDGRFVSIPDNAYSVGQEINLLQRESFKKKHHSSFRQRAAAIAASAVLVLSLGGGGLAYAMPYGTVSIDVNPSIEYTINRFDRVLRVSGINEDGQAVLEAIDRNKLLNRRIDDAVTATLSQLEEEGYLSGEEDAIVFSSGTGSEAHSASLAASLEEKFSPQAEIYSVAVSREEIETAHKKGTTAGKMRLFDRLAQDSPENFPEADWIDRPVNDLMHAIHQKGLPSDSAQSGEVFSPSGPHGNHHSFPEESPSSPRDETFFGVDLPGGNQSQHALAQQNENSSQPVPDPSPDNHPGGEPFRNDEENHTASPPVTDGNMFPDGEHRMTGGRDDHQERRGN
jgi:hypothetical protein